MLVIASAAACWLAVVFGGGAMLPVEGTSVKIDYLPFADVRTDPIINPTCLSDHVHTFFGAAVNPRPETTYADLIAANGNSGNVKENKSLYWYPTIYSLEDNGLYVKDQVWFSSSYYVWTTGQTKAFPQGFKMVALGEEEMAMASASCAGEAPCTKQFCSPDRFLPPTRCYELEISLVFPSCWNGVDLDTPDHRSHVAYTHDGEHTGNCPPTHPVRIPQIHLYTRLKDYSGGRHVFSDGSDVIHADYFAGWNETFLQNLLDTCSNPSQSSNPDAFCGQFLTFRDTVGIKPDEAKDDEKIASDLIPIQPPAVDTTKITTEAVNNVPTLPRGACSGTLLGGGTPTTNSPTTPTTKTPTSAPTTKSPTTPTTKAPTTKSPTTIPTVAPGPDLDSEDPDIFTMPIIIGAVVGCFVFAAAIATIIMKQGTAATAATAPSSATVAMKKVDV